jgi:hypothetical protein
MFGKRPQLIVIEAGRLMGEEEILAAFAVGKDTPWWRALMQEIETFRMDAITAAAAHGALEKKLAMSGAIGGHEILTNLLIRLNELREEGVGE